ncbi:MAG: hypothetical protein QXD79_07945 [Candidatus Methanomethylicia archaeon]
MEGKYFIVYCEEAGKNLMISKLCDSAYIEINRVYPFLKVARLKYEWLEDVEDPYVYIKMLKGRADIFTFWQRPPDIKPKYDFPFEWDNMAVLIIKSYKFWWEKQINKKTRNMVRKSQKMGVKVLCSPLTDDFIRGIVKIYNETPIRQNKPFRHYGKTFEQVKEKFSILPTKYKEDFIGAYYNNELIGFIHLIYSGKCALISQILSMIKHRDKAPNNALIAKTVEVCASKGIKFLIYERMSAGSLGEFKQNNGFIKLYVPRYYVPLSFKGKLAIYFNLHKGIKGFLPDKVKDYLRPKRNYLFKIAFRSKRIRKILKILV